MLISRDAEGFMVRARLGTPGVLFISPLTKV